jgi:hypothetical protein
LKSKKKEQAKMDFEKEKLNPAALGPSRSCFNSNIVARTKIEILRRWEQDATLMEVAEEEGMSGPQPKLLQPSSRRSPHAKPLAEYRTVGSQQSVRNGTAISR